MRISRKIKIIKGVERDITVTKNHPFHLNSFFRARRLNDAPNSHAIIILSYKSESRFVSEETLLEMLQESTKY